MRYSPPAAPAARVGDQYTCAANSHGALLAPGVPTVLIAGNAAAVVGTVGTCTSPQGRVEQVAVVTGSTTVLIGGKPAARVGDPLTDGGRIISGCTTVLIGG